MLIMKTKGYKYISKSEEYFISDLLKGIDIEVSFVKIKNNIITVRKEYAYDGPSGPTIDTKAFLFGSLYHDAMYQLMREGILDRKKYKSIADKLMREVCLREGMCEFRAWYTYKTVTYFKGGTKPKKRPRGRIIELKSLRFSMAEV